MLLVLGTRVNGQRPIYFLLSNFGQMGLSCLVHLHFALLAAAATMEDYLIVMPETKIVNGAKHAKEALEGVYEPNCLMFTISKTKLPTKLDQNCTSLFHTSISK